MSDLPFQSVNPASGAPLTRTAHTTPEALEAQIARTAAAQQRWERRPLAERVKCLQAAATLLRGDARELAVLMATEMGKPLAQGVAEAEKCAWACDYYAAEAARLLADEAIATDAARSYVAYRPLGLVLAIMPWNFPLWQVLRCAAPNLVAGNAVVLKHAPNVSGCARAIVDLCLRAGFPEDLLPTVYLPLDRLAALIGDPRVAAVTLTGSTEAGRSVAQTAGRHVKPTVLELGGSDPYIVLADADIARAAETCVASRLINSGQSCIAAKRFIVVQEVAADFTEAVVVAMADRTWGDPLAEGIDVGPLARSDLRDRLAAQVDASVALGATVLTGAVVPEGPGWFYPPTVLADVAPDMPVAREETFGPVAALLTVPDERAAIETANGLSYGLGAAVFTADVARGERIAKEELRVGSAFVNAFVRSDPRLPFGGVGLSGFGRELGVPGLRSFLNVKTVYVAA